ncbi:MAG TPA: hypothetical protein VG819_03500 [Rhizomicrobium sp.]|nr:hypothetical protein [Rhizomicrobium sp.]
MQNPAAWVEALRARAAMLAARIGVAPRVLLFSAIPAGLAALPAIATGRTGPGAVFIAVSRLFVFAGSEGTGGRDIARAASLDLFALASIPFAFALYDPGSGVAAALLLFAMIAAASASLFADPARGIAERDRLICAAAFVLACIRREWFALLAYLLALLCFAGAGSRLAAALLRGGR